jgi:hypothetical protein
VELDGVVEQVGRGLVCEACSCSRKFGVYKKRRGLVQHDEETCGQELAASGVVPEQISALFKHVAINPRDHAVWAGSASVDAKREHDAMIEVARGYESIGVAARHTSELMRSLGALPAVVHDPGKMDRTKFIVWMEGGDRIAEETREHVAGALAAIGTCSRESERVACRLNAQRPSHRA